MARISRWVVGVAAPLALSLGVVSCGEGVAKPIVSTDEDPAEFIAVREAWLPGERDAYIQRVMANHELVFPYVGDISSMAPEIFSDPDSHVVLVPNPAWVPVLAPSAASPQGPSLAPRFASNWNFIGMKLTIIDNTGVVPDTLFWHLAIWSRPSNGLDFGFAIAFQRNTAFNIRPINAATFDASGGTNGAASGEFHASTGTYWEDDASGGRYQVTSQSYPGAFSTVSSGPFLGGLSRTGVQFGRVTSSKMFRQSGTENPSSFTVSFDYRGTGIPSTEVVCDFPTPCTTNVPGLMAALHQAAESEDRP